MNITEVRDIIRQVIAEAKEGGLPKSGGKLVHLKKELEGLKQMKESLAAQTVNEGDAQPFVAEYAHMQKFVNELEKIKALSAKLAEMLDSQITEVEGKIGTETTKIKEMVGLIEKAPKKATKKAAPKAEKEETKADEKEEPKKKAKELEEARFEKGEDIGKPGAGFKKVAKAAEKEYGSKEAGQKVAGAILKKVLAKK